MLQLQRIAAGAGAPEKYNLTVTLSFMSLIAEAMEATPRLDFDDFAEYRHTKIGWPDSQFLIVGGKLWEGSCTTPGSHIVHHATKEPSK